MLDFNFKLKYSNRESEKPEIVKFMSNVLPCPCEFNGDLVRFCKQPSLYADEISPGGAKRKVENNTDSFKIHISWKTTLDYNFELNY